MRLFSSESVSEGHPDKIADQISDAVLDAMLVDDPDSRVACETLVTTGMAMVAGEITTETYVDIPGIVRDTLARIGYDRSEYGIDARTCAVLSTLDKQSPDIAQGVDVGGAGDQGMMFGFACDETPELMPAPLVFAHRITKRMAELRKSGQVPWMRPDSKSQVTLAYEGDLPVKVHTVVVSTQHDEDVDNDTISQVVREQVVAPVLPDELFDPGTCVFHINPTGKFVIGGPHGDAGLTGRKIIVDTYGGVGRHGGGAFSGKDATKVDRSAAYAARWAAKNVVASGAAARCEIQLAYAIGVVEPVSVHVDTFGTGVVPEARIREALVDVFDFTPAGIISALDLRSPIFLPTAVYGHFGRRSTEGEAEIMGPRENGGPAPRVRYFPWEATDRAGDLKTALGL
jgi:S-adenosylmethionine synthetase